MVAMKQLYIGIFIFLLSFILTSFPSYSSPLGIKIIYEEHYIWGFAGQHVVDGPIENYDLFDTQPISHTATGYEFYQDPWPPESQSSFASAGNFVHELAINRQLAGAWAESSYTFTTDYDDLAFTAFGYTNQTHLEDKLIVSLIDVTEDFDIFNYVTSTQSDSPYGVVNSLVVDEIFNINKGHVYRLYMYSEVTSGDSEAEAIFTINLSSKAQPVPEPSTVALLSVGLAGSFAFRMRKKRKV